MTRVNRLILIMTAAAVLCAVTAPVCRAELSDDQAREYRIKAACLMKFLRFVTFPANQRDGTFRVCVMGSADSVKLMQNELRNKAIGRRKILVERVTTAEQLIRKSRKYHILFVSGDALDGSAAAIMNVQKHAHVVVGETAGFCRNGGMICMRIENNRIRFEINPDAAGKKQVKISSQLLKLATIVTGTSSPTSSSTTER